MHHIPTINVNLKSCDCAVSMGETAMHRNVCPGKPVLIPCPIPRSVTFEVRLGRCECSLRFTGVTGFGVSEPQGQHSTDCPARPIRVTCSISGKTWAESEVEDISPVKTDGRGVYEVGWERGQVEPVTRAVHERWALVKALVLGRDLAEPEVPVTAAQGLLALFQQRDAVFSALMKARWNEDGLIDATNEAVMAIGGGLIPAFGRRPSDELLARYVERLIEQVGVLE